MHLRSIPAHQIIGCAHMSVCSASNPDNQCHLATGMVGSNSECGHVHHPPLTTEHVAAVHEYGGGESLVTASAVYFSNFRWAGRVGTGRRAGRSYPNHMHLVPHEDLHQARFWLRSESALACECTRHAGLLGDQQLKHLPPHPPPPHPSETSKCGPRIWRGQLLDA